MARRRVGSRKARCVDEARRRVMVPFEIRGTSRLFAPAGRQVPQLHASQAEYPVYHVDPFYRMPALEWADRLKATLYAATARAIEHGGFELVDWSQHHAINPARLPVIVVFKQTENVAALTKFMRSPKGRPGSGARFSEPFEQRRAYAEQALVHGRARPTFRETSLSSGLASHEKAFEVRMSVTEFRDIIRQIDSVLQAKAGLSFDELVRRGPAARKKALAKTPYAMRGYTQETSFQSPVAHAFYVEAARLMADKFLRISRAWMDKHLPAPGRAPNVKA